MNSERVGVCVRAGAQRNWNFSKREPDRRKRFAHPRTKLARGTDRSEGDGAPRSGGEDRGHHHQHAGAPRREPRLQSS